MERKLWRTALTVSFAFLLMVIIGSCQEASAEERVLPAGTVVILPESASVYGDCLLLPGFPNRDCFVTTDTHFLVERASLDRANGAAEMNRSLTKSLMQCSAVLQERRKPEASWKVAARWTGIGMAVGGAFALGVLASK